MEALSTGRVISGLTALVGSLIVLSGLLPLHWFHFQDYEIARQILHFDSPFIPNVKLRTQFFEGNEAEAGNLEPTESLPWRNFSTDRFGFRYCPPVDPGKPAQIVVFRGFSFVFGVGLGDEDTFPAQLARHAGMNAYNASRFYGDPETPEDFDAILAKIGARPETVVYVHLEPNALVLDDTDRQYNLPRRLLWYAKELPMQWLRLSPVVLTAMEAKKAVENDVILHNRYLDHVQSFTLPDGNRILVRKGDLERARTEFPDSVVAERSEYIAWWAKRIAERGARMVVLLVPDKMSVYGPSLGVPVPAQPFLDRMQRDLEARGLPVVNGLTVLRATAAEDVATGRLAYLREDEHWNRLGVERLARATAAAIRPQPGYAIESSKIR